MHCICIHTYPRTDGFNICVSLHKHGRRLPFWKWLYFHISATRRLATANRLPVSARLTIFTRQTPPPRRRTLRKLSSHLVWSACTIWMLCDIPCGHIYRFQKGGCWCPPRWVTVAWSTGKHASFLVWSPCRIWSL